MEKRKVAIDDLDYDALNSSVTYEDESFSGIAYETVAATGEYVEQEYLEGLPHGIVRTWSADSVLREEETFKYGAKEGPYRQWDKTGRLIEEGLYERGILILQTQYDEAGNVVQAFKLTPESPAYSTLEHLRKITIPAPWK